MNFVKPSFEIITDISPNASKELKLIERVARTCYKSEDLISEDDSSARKMVKMLIDKDHLAMIEHSMLTVKFVVNRGIADEFIRHRPCSFAVESTRWCNYGRARFNGITFVVPLWLRKASEEERQEWARMCRESEDAYLRIINSGRPPEEARTVLPLCVKSEMVITANYREWRHIFELRTAPDAHPDMRYIMTRLLEELQNRIPVVFDDILTK